MIRKFQNTDIDQIAEIWLDTNIKTHKFIPAQYWQQNFLLVKALFLDAELYVYESEERSELQGFIGLDHDYIAGIFVRDEVQSGGIGKQLLEYVKERKINLSLRVYKKNVGAVRFYQRENFVIQCEGVDQDTNEEDYTMVWMQRREDRFDNGMSEC